MCSASTDASSQLSHSGEILVLSLEIDEGQMVSVTTASGRPVLLARVDGEVYAVSDVCSHLRARLHRGSLAGFRVRCPLHGGAFDVRDGSAVCEPATVGVDSFPVRIDGNRIEVTVPAAAETSVPGFEW